MFIVIKLLTLTIIQIQIIYRQCSKSH